MREGAVAVCDEFQVTGALRFCMLLSLKVPVAVNCCVCPYVTGRTSFLWLSARGMPEKRSILSSLTNIL
jgi:hypothetical protein